MPTEGDDDMTDETTVPEQAPQPEAIGPALLDERTPGQHLLYSG